MTVIDSHLHLFKANSKDYPRPVHPGLADEDREVLAKELIIKMEKAGVDKAIVVPLGPEDHYLSELQEAYPGKFPFRHFISRNFSAPRSAPNPASVTT